MKGRGGEERKDLITCSRKISEMGRESRESDFFFLKSPKL